MKKLIGILSSFVSAFSLSTTVVSCESNNNQESKKRNNDENESTIPTNNFVDSKIDTDLLETILSDEGIDGSMLNTNSTGADTLILIKDAIFDVEPTVTNVEFVNEDEANDFLDKGDNYFTVSFTVKNENLEYPVYVKDVQDANMLDKDELSIFVKGILNDQDLLEVGYEDEDINTDDITKWKKVIGQRIHQKASSATINIKTASTSKRGEVNVTIEVDNLPDGIQKITKQILYSSNKISFNTSLTPNSTTFEAAVKQISGLSFQNQSLTTHNLKKDAFNSIKKSIIDYFMNNKLPEPKIEYDALEMNKHLTEGKNEIKVTISKPVGSSNNTTNEITFLLNGVKKETEYNTYQNMVKERLLMGINANKFNDKDSYEVILPCLNAVAKEFESSIHIELKNKNQIKTLLKANDNRIDVAINLEGHTPVYATALLKDVKSFSLLEDVKNRYVTERTFEQTSSSYTYGNVITEYQNKIKLNFANAAISISLKDPSKLNQKLSEGTNQIEVKYTQNGKTLDGMIKPFLNVKYPTSSKPNPNGLPKIMSYVNKGITTAELKANLTTENNLYEAFLAIRKFIATLESVDHINVDHPTSTLNSKLKIGDNKVNVEIHKKGTAPTKLTFTIKNVVAKPDHYVPDQQHRNPRDKKLWDFYEQNKELKLPSFVTGYPKEYIILIFKDHIEKNKIAGIQILASEKEKSSKEKMVSKSNFQFEIVIRDTVTNYGIGVKINVFVL